MTVLLTLLVLLFAGAGAPVPAGGLEPLRQDSGLYLVAGQPIGYYRRATWREEDGSYRSEIFQRLVIARVGERFTITRREVWLEDEALRRVEAETDMNGQVQRLTARATGAGIEAMLEIGGSIQRETLPAEGRVLGVYLADREVAEAVRRGQPGVSYLSFLAEEMRVDRADVRLLGEGSLSDSMGRAHRGVLAEERLSGYPQTPTRSVLDPAGGLLYSRTSYGLPMEMIRTDIGLEAAERMLNDSYTAADVASLGIPVEGLAVLGSRVARIRSARLRFSGEGLGTLEERLREEAADLGPEAVRCERRGEELEAWLASPSLPPPSAAAGGGAGPLSRYTAGGFYLDLEDPRLEEILGRARRKGVLDLQRLADEVFAAIRTKSTRYGFAGTREILDSREGDCTEHSLLLVSLLRKAGLPARIAYGFVLLDDGFQGHAWTEVYLAGRWHRMDPSFRGWEAGRLKIRLGIYDPSFPISGQTGTSLLQVAGAVRGRLLEWSTDALR